MSPDEMPKAGAEEASGTPSQDLAEMPVENSAAAVPLPPNENVPGLPSQDLPSVPAVPANLKCLVEALLFVAEGPVTVAALARPLEVAVEQVDAILNELADEYTGRGMRLQRVRDKVQLVSAPEAAAVIQKFLGVNSAGHLSGPALETLAIIAYRQPVTRPVIESVRGVNCDGVIHSLLARGLIQEMGRMETAGRPILYGTTFEFLQNFGLRGVDDLPPLEQAAESVLSAAIEQAQVTANAVAERIK